MTTYLQAERMYFFHLRYVDQALEGTFWRSEKPGHNKFVAEEIIRNGIPERWK